MLGVETDPVVGYREPDCSCILKSELHLDPGCTAMARRVGQRLAGNAEPGSGPSITLAGEF